MAAWQGLSLSLQPVLLMCVTEATAKLAFCVIATHEGLITFLGPFMLQTDEGQQAYGN